MDALSIGRPPAAKAADQLRAEARDRAAQRRAMVGLALDHAGTLGWLILAVLGVVVLAG